MTSTRGIILTRNVFMAIGYALGYWNASQDMGLTNAMLTIGAFILIGLFWPNKR